MAKNSFSPSNDIVIITDVRDGGKKRHTLRALPENPEISAAPDDSVRRVIGVEDPVGCIELHRQRREYHRQLRLARRLLHRVAGDARWHSASAWNKQAAIIGEGVKGDRGERDAHAYYYTYKEEICRFTMLTVPLSLALYDAVTHFPPNSNKAK